MKPITRLAFSLGLLLMATWALQADIVILKDGFVLQGVVKRESVTEFDPVSKEPIVIPKGFYMVDDGARRIYFNPGLVRSLDKRDPPQEERFVHPKALFIPGGKGPPAFFSELDSTAWDAKWERTFRYRSPVGIVGLYQHMSFLSSYAARVDATNKFVFSSMYLTQELGPETCLKLIATHPDFQNLGKAKPEEVASKKFRVVDFLAQAGWFPEAEEEIKKIIVDLPEQEGRAKKALESLAALRGSERLEKIKRIYAAGRTREARKLADAFPPKEAQDKVLTGLQTLQTRMEKGNESLELAKKHLYLLAQDLREKKTPTIFPDCLETISRELTETNLERLEVFLSQASQTDNPGGEGQGKKSDHLAALAVSGWLMGNTAADPNPTLALKLWATRNFILDYAKKENRVEQKKRLDQFIKESPVKPPLDEIAIVLSNLPSILPTRASGGSPFARKIPSGRNKDLSYSLRLPADFNENQAYPVLILFPKNGESVAEQMETWGPLADENATILAGFQWGQENRTYGFSDKEHFEILDIVRDLKLHFPVDPDRVFLFGLEQGAQVAYDIGLSHPDLFAGVIPMSTSPEMFIEKYWRNGQYLPFYVVGGDRSGEPNTKTRAIFNTWIPRSYPSIWIQYKGRGLEWFKAEVPLVFDWMRLKRRNFPMNQLGTDGGGGVLGNEFQSTRFCDNQFYWIGSETVLESRINNANNWRANLSPATFFAKAEKGTNTITVRISGMKNYYLLLGRNSKGETQVDFGKPVTVSTGLTSKWTGKITPSLETLMEHLMETGDRKNLVYFKLEIKP